MPATPYAKVLASVGGGAPTSGGLDVAGGSTLDLSAESTVGWKQAVWEFYDYPEGWATPAGWTLRADGVVFYAGFTPPQITMPLASVRWGVWMLRLRVNEQVIDDKNRLANLLDDTTAISIASPKGQRDIGARERSHFTTESTRLKAWLRSYQRNLRVIEGLLGGAGSELESDDFNWQPDTNYPVASRLRSVDTNDASWTPIHTFALEDESCADYNATILARSDDGKHFRLDLRGAWERTDGTVTELDAPSTDNALSAGNPAGWDARLINVGTNVLTQVKGEAGVTVRWSGTASAQVVKIEATPAVVVVDPESMALSADWETAFTASPWTDTASAGTSGGRTLSVSGGNPPAAGTKDGIACAVFDGVNDRLVSAALESDLFTANEGGGVILYHALAADLPAAAGGIIADPGMFAGQGGYITTALNATGPRFGLYDTGYKNIQLTGGLDGWHVLCFRWKWDSGLGSGAFQARLDSTEEGTKWSVGTAMTGPVGDLTSPFNVGCNYVPDAFAKFGLRNIRTFKHYPTDDEIDDIIAAINDEHGLAL